MPRGFQTPGLVSLKRIASDKICMTRRVFSVYIVRTLPFDKARFNVLYLTWPQPETGTFRRAVTCVQVLQQVISLHLI